MTGHHNLLNLFVIRLWISAGLLDSFNHFFRFRPLQYNCSYMA